MTSKTGSPGGLPTQRIVGIWVIAMICGLGLSACGAGDRGRLAAPEDAVEWTNPQIPPDPPQLRDLSRRPNILFILTDDQPLGYLRAMPFTSKLIFGRGTSFENAFVTTPLCCPSRSTILTGRYAHNHGVLSNAGRGGADTFRATGSEASTVATWLRNDGYQTAFIGKYLNQYPGSTEAVPPYVPSGWDEWFVPIDVYPTKTPYAQYEYSIVDNGNIVAFGADEADYFSDVVRSRSMAFLRDAVSKDAPFFLAMSFISPHAPGVSARRHAEFFSDEALERLPSFNESDISDKPRWLQSSPILTEEEVARTLDLHQKMLRSLVAVDEAIRSVVGFLAAQDALDDTYLIFMSDNGLHLGEHRITVDKNTPYEEAIRVPLAIWGSGITPGSARTELVLNTDIAPTIAELAGVEIPVQVDGRSLLPLGISNHVDAGAAWRRRFLVEHFAPYVSEVGLIDSRPNRLEYSAIRTVSHLYVQYAYGEAELYDLEQDPYQLQNIVLQADQALLDSLQEQLGWLVGCSGGGCMDAENR